MTVLTTSLPLAAGILAAVLVAVVAVWWFVPALRAWPPALGLMLVAATLVPPHVTVAAGVGADDVPVLLGLVVLAIPAYRAIRAGWLRPVPSGVVVAVGRPCWRRPWSCHRSSTPWVWARPSAC